MKNIISVAIGIPAYNEEDNIQELLRSLIVQKQKRTKINEIIVVSDGSSDKTVEKIKDLKSELLTLVVNMDRQGQAIAQNTILKKNKSDILVLLNADIKINDKFFIEKLVEPLLIDRNVGIVSPMVVPLPPKGLFDSIINHSVYFKNSMYFEWKNGNNIYICHGRARAFSKNFLKILRWDKVLSEDAYSFFLAVSNDFRFVYQPNTKVFYRSPINFSDHQKQSTRFLMSVNELSRFFPKKTVVEEYSIPKSLVIKKFIEYFFANPFFQISYSVIFLLIKILPYKNTNYFFEVSASSKKIKD